LQELASYYLFSRNEKDVAVEHWFLPVLIPTHSLLRVN